MAIKINNVEITAVEFNGNPIYTVVHIDKTTKKETIVFGGTVQPPAIVSQITATYNTLTFLVKNMDYRICNITVYAVPMTSGHLTRTKTFNLIPASGDNGSQFTCYMGSGGEYLDSNVKYKLYATAITGTDQSESSVPVYKTTLSESTKAPIINEIRNYYPSYDWNVTNTDDNVATIRTWVEKNGILVPDTEYFTYANIAKNAVTSPNISYSTKGTLVAGSSYVIRATAQDSTGKLLTSSYKNITPSLPEATLIPLSSILYPVLGNTYKVEVTLTNRENEKPAGQRAAAYLYADLYKVDPNGDMYVDSRYTTYLVQPGDYVTFDFLDLEPGKQYYIKKKADGYYKISSGWSTRSSADYFYTKCTVTWAWRNENSEIFTIGRIDTVDRGTNVYADTQLSPTRVGWSFDKWDQPLFYITPNYLTITKNEFIEAKFIKNSYLVNWRSRLGDTLIKGRLYEYNTQILAYTINGVEPQYPPNPTESTYLNEKYIFKSWNPIPYYTVQANNKNKIYAEWTKLGYAKWWDGYTREDIAGSPPLYIKKEQFAANQVVPSSSYPWLNATDQACKDWVSTHPRSINYKFKQWNPAPGFNMPSTDGVDREITAEWISQYYGMWHNGVNAYVKGDPLNEPILYDNGYQLVSTDYPTAAQVNSSFGTAKYFFTGWDKQPNTELTKFNGSNIKIKATSKAYGYAKWWYNFPTNDYEFKKVQLAPNEPISEYYPTDIPIRAGWKFKGWIPAANSSPVMPSGGTDKDIYADWTQQVIITWKTYDGSISYGTTILDINSYIISKEQYYSATRTNYDWDGWSLNINGALISFSGNGYQVTQDITLFAIFTPKLYTLTFWGYTDRVTPLVNPPKQYRYGYSIPTADIPTSYGVLPVNTKDNNWDKTIPSTMPGNDLVVTRLYDYYSPAIPTNVGTLNNIVNSIPVVTVSWGKVDYASKYTIRYYYIDSGGNRFPPTIDTYSTIDITTIPVGPAGTVMSYDLNPNKDYGRKYYVSVSASNLGKSSGYSTQISSTVEWSLPSAPSLTYTITKTTNIYINASWVKPSYADDAYIFRYFYVDKYTGIESSMYEIPLTTISYSLQVFTSRTYYFSVAAKRFDKVGIYASDRIVDIWQYETKLYLDGSLWATFTDDIGTKYNGVADILTRVGKSAPSQVGYDWTGWTGITYPYTVLSSETFYSTLNIQKFNCSWADKDGAITPKVYDYGTKITVAPIDPGVPDYKKLTGWNPAFSPKVPYEIKSVVNFTPIYDWIIYKVTWYDFLRSSTFSTGDYIYNQNAVYPKTYPKNYNTIGGYYRYTGWNPSSYTVIGDKTITSVTTFQAVTADPSFVNETLVKSHNSLAITVKNNDSSQVKITIRAWNLDKSSTVGSGSTSVLINSGAEIQVAVTGLSPLTSYYLEIKAAAEAQTGKEGSNWIMSNTAFITSSVPAMSTPAMVQQSKTQDSITVRFTNADGNASGWLYYTRSRTAAYTGYLKYPTAVSPYTYVDIAFTGLTAGTTYNFYSYMVPVDTNNYSTSPEAGPLAITTNTIPTAMPYIHTINPYRSGSQYYLSFEVRNNDASQAYVEVDLYKGSWSTLKEINKDIAANTSSSYNSLMGTTSGAWFGVYAKATASGKTISGEDGFSGTFGATSNMTTDALVMQGRSWGSTSTNVYWDKINGSANPADYEIVRRSHGTGTWSSALSGIYYNSNTAHLNIDLYDLTQGVLYDYRVRIKGSSIYYYLFKA